MTTRWARLLVAAVLALAALVGCGDDYGGDGGGRDTTETSAEQDGPAGSNPDSDALDDNDGDPSDAGQSEP